MEYVVYIVPAATAVEQVENVLLLWFSGFTSQSYIRVVPGAVGMRDFRSGMAITPYRFAVMSLGIEPWYEPQLVAMTLHIKYICQREGSLGDYSTPAQHSNICGSPPTGT